jgi:hypothetical protein
MDQQPGSVEVGPYELRVGGEAGTLAQRAPTESVAEIEPLQRALGEPAAKRADGEPAIATEIDEAAEATAKVEQATALCKGIAEGHALDPVQLSLEVGVLLGCLERLDRRKNYKKALRMARALATLLMLLKRWADLLQTLRIGLRAGEELGDQAAIAWARHELGTLRLAAGDVEGADRELRQAREIRERIGDRRGLAATERNMQVLCDRLRRMLRDEELVRRRRPSRMRVLSLATTLALLFGAAGFGAGLLAGGSEEPAGQTRVAEEGVEVGSGPGEGDDGVAAVAERFPLVVTIAGEGSGAVEGESLTCERTCEVELPAGAEVVLDGVAGEGSAFDGFSGACSGSGPCALTMNEPQSVTATFSPLPEEGTVPEASDSSGTFDGEPTEEDLPEEEEEEAQGIDAEGP